MRERASDLFRLMEVEVVERGYEGYVAKDGTSAHDGGATPWWLKVKQRGWTVEGDGWQRRIFEEDRR